MPSDPSASKSSSSSAKTSSSSSPSSKPSSSSSSKPSSSSSSSRLSGSGSSSSSSSSAPKPSTTGADAKPPQPTPFISANAWMSFFLFVCLVLVILQGPLGLGTQAQGVPPYPLGVGVPYVAAAHTQAAPPRWACNGPTAYVQFPWCAPAAVPMPVAQCSMPPCGTTRVVERRVVEPAYVEREPEREREQRYAHPGHQMGGQGHVATPGGGAGFSWYSNPDGPAEAYGRQDRDVRERRETRPYRSVRYTRPGMQVEIESGDAPVRRRTRLVRRTEQVRVAAPVQAVPGMANLENAFYPLLIGAIALLVIFDYAS